MTYPTTLPGLTATNPTSGDTLATGPHHTLHSDERIAIDALGAKVGVDSSAVTTSHDYKLSGVTGSFKAKSTAVTVFGLATSVTDPVAQVADSTSVGGNARGANAVDWQTTRAIGSQVASGAKSMILGGRNSTAAGTNAIAAGDAVSAAATNSVYIGGDNGSVSAVGSGAFACNGASIASGADYATHIGGSSSATGANAKYSCVIGSTDGQASNDYQLVHAAGISVNGDCQKSEHLAYIQTTNNTQAELKTPNQQVRMQLPNDTVWAFKARIVSRRTDANGENSYWTVEGLIARDANAASTAIIGTVTTTLLSQDAAASAQAITCVADTTNGALVFKVTGETSKTIRWFATIETLELTG